MIDVSLKDDIKLVALCKKIIFSSIDLDDLINDGATDNNRVRATRSS